MKILIEKSAGTLDLDVSWAGYDGAAREAWRSGQEHDIVSSSTEGLLFKGIKPGDQVIPFGSIEFIKKTAELLEVNLPVPLNVPEILQPHIGRKVWTSRRSELKRFPVFVKPLTEVKLFTGFLATSANSFSLYKELNNWDGELFCSEPMPEIVSEWRCYIVKGQITACCNYAGNPIVFPDANEVNRLIDKYVGAPEGYAMDVAVTAAGTRLVECNDAWGLGYYGGDTVGYFKMVKSRWLEIVNADVAQR